MRRDLVLRTGSDSALARPAYRPRPLTWRQRREQLPARDAEARIDAAAYATHHALMHAELLSAQEQRAIQNAPLGEPRYEAIVDAFVGVASSEIIRLAEGGGQ